MTILNKILADLETSKTWDASNEDVEKGLDIAIGKIKDYLADEKESIEQAHMAGQKDAGVDPSSYEAFVYFQNKVEPTILTDGD